MLSGHSLRISGHAFIHACKCTHAHTHTDYYKLSLMCTLQVLTRACSKIASYPGPLRKGLGCIARTCADVVGCVSIVTGHEQCMHSSIYKRVWFFWGHLAHAHANVNLDLDTKAHRIERKCTQYTMWIQAHQSKSVQVHVVATQLKSLSEQ